VTAQEVRLATVRGTLTEESPQLQLAQRELASLRAQLTQAERDQPSKNAPGADYLNRFRDFKYQDKLFGSMARQYEIARLDEARGGAVIQVVDSAMVPEARAKQKRAQDAVLTTLGAGLVLLLFVFVRESLHKGAIDPEVSGKLSRITGVGRSTQGPERTYIRRGKRAIGLRSVPARQSPVTTTRSGAKAVSGFCSQ